MKPSQTIEQMRPELPTLDAGWSARSLDSILANRRRTPSRVRRVAMGAAALVLATGGVAYATGNVPVFIEKQFDRISPSEVHDVRRIASFNLTTGDSVREFEVFRATNDAGETCFITHEADARFAPNSDGACAVDPIDGWFSWTSESARMGEPMPDATLYIYGERPSDDVTKVRAFGVGFNHTMTVDPTTGGFATAIPEVTLKKHGEVAGRTIATLEFLDLHGDVIATKPLLER